MHTDYFLLLCRDLVTSLSDEIRGDVPALVESLDAIAELLVPVMDNAKATELAILLQRVTERLSTKEEYRWVEEELGVVLDAFLPATIRD